MRHATWRLAACLCGVLASVSLHGGPLEDFRDLVDNRLAIRSSLGVRSARALDNQRVEVVIGLSATRAAANPESWRIISYDDPNYVYEKFVKPTRATVRREREAQGVTGSPFPEYQRTIVTLTLPEPLKPGVQYYAMGQGVNGEMVTAAHTSAGFVYQAESAPPKWDDPAVHQAVLGLRQVEPVGPGIIRLEFGTNFSAQAAANLDNYKLSIAGAPIKATSFGRRTMLDTYLPVGWPFQAIPLHHVFLELERPLKDGETLDVEVAAAVTGSANRAQMRFDSTSSFSQSIKVNQVGYLTNSPVKVAYLGRWMGSFPEGRQGESSALSFEQPPAFELRSDRDGAVVFTGQSKLIHRSGQKNEGVHRVDHSGENVYLLDFTAVKTPGRYFISVPGVGRSIAFDIGDDVYVKAFELQAYGVFAQRCGMELMPPYSEWRRIACHTNGLVVTTQVRGERHNIRDLRSKATDRKIMAFGGHHDAGDYNPRSHLDVAQTLMDAYELAPRKFYDGQLNIPEKGNGLPDILDEAFWALRLWIDLQDEDGGVFNGTESAGDPNFIETVELDPTGDFAYAKDAAGSFSFAGAMAQASRLWRASGKTQEADDFLTRARRAYEWASNNPPANTSPQQYSTQFLDKKAYAAAQMLKTTGEERFNRDFLDACVWSRNKEAELDEHAQYDQSLAALAYATCDEKFVDTQMQQTVRRAIIRRADWFINNAQTMAYGFIRHPYAPINWGTGAYENFLPPVLWAWRLTGDEKYLHWVVRTCDNTLGANPLGLSWIVGLGERTVRAPLHNSRYSHIGEVHPGAQVEGPVQSGEGYRVTEVAYPPIQTDFANLYTYVDAHFAIAMNELVVPAQAKTMATFGLLLPDHE